MNITPVTEIEKKHIAIMDTSSISFMQGLRDKGIDIGPILKDYDLMIIPEWVMTEVVDSESRSSFVQELIDKGYPIKSIAEERYAEMTGCEEGNLYQIVLASTYLLARIRSYLRRYVETADPIDMSAYSEWVKKLYDEWPISGEMLSSGRVKKKNAGEVSITILAEVISWYYPDTEVLTIYSQDGDVYEFQRNAEKILRDVFADKAPIPVSYKSNDAIICQLFRLGVIKAEEVSQYRKDERKITYSKEQSDHSIVLVKERVDNDSFIKLISDTTVHIIF